ncbi:hypothetical protein BDZ89DRAFT_1049305 [Hymenopellis radicata]|nr:hypothetical protein BDZ89DRAFT_1049305 [Hymenopellis radicata]
MIMHDSAVNTARDDDPETATSADQHDQSEHDQDGCEHKHDDHEQERHGQQRAHTVSNAEDVIPAWAALIELVGLDVENGISLFTPLLNLHSDILEPRWTGINANHNMGKAEADYQTNAGGKRPGKRLD